MRQVRRRAPKNSAGEGNGRHRDTAGKGFASVAALVLYSVVAICIPPQIGAWQWPLTSFNVDAGFGQLREGRVSTAVWLSAETPDVRAAHPGEIVFQRREGAEAARYPHAFGNFTVITHEDDLRSLYSNMGMVDPPAENDVEAGDRIGTVGVSGFAYGDQLGVHLIDAELRQLVNPLLILPPRVDDAAPVIGAVSVELDGNTRPLRQGLRIPQGRRFAVYVDAYDAVAAGTGRRRIAPREIRVALGDGEAEIVDFETIRPADGGLRLADGGSLTDMYAPDGSMRVGSFTMGAEITRLSVRVEDFAGNRASAEYRLLPIADSGAAGQ